MNSLLGKIKWQFILFLARRLPDCKSITPVLGEMLDRELTLREKIVTRLHLFTCEACRRYLQQVKFLHDALRNHEEMFANAVEDEGIALSSDAKERLKKILSSSTRPAV